MRANSRPRYEVAGAGGPAGSTTALYTARLGRRTAVFEGEGGRHAAVARVHDAPGISEGVSGRELVDRALEQVETCGGDSDLDAVERIGRVEGDHPFRRGAARATHDESAAHAAMTVLTFTGDVAHGRNRATIAIGDGADAGIAPHEETRRFPGSIEAADAREPGGATEHDG